MVLPPSFRRNHYSKTLKHQKDGEESTSRQQWTDSLIFHWVYGFCSAWTERMCAQIHYRSKVVLEYILLSVGRAKPGIARQALDGAHRSQRSQPFSRSPSSCTRRRWPRVGSFADVVLDSLDSTSSAAPRSPSGEHGDGLVHAAALDRGANVTLALAAWHAPRSTGPAWRQWWRSTWWIEPISAEAITRTHRRQLGRSCWPAARRINWSRRASCVWWSFDEAASENNNTRS